jgi:hypothetical protein
MSEALVAGLIFVCLLIASLGSLVLYRKLPAHHREDETINVVRMIANISA